MAGDRQDTPMTAEQISKMHEPLPGVMIVPEE